MNPSLKGDQTHLGFIEPKVKFAQGFDFGDLWAQVGLPFHYWDGPDYGWEDLNSTDIKFYVGFDSSFGLGLEYSLAANIANNWKDKTHGIYEYETGVIGHDIIISYDSDAFHAEVEIEADKEFKTVSITPEFEYYLGKITIWAELGIDIAEDIDTAITPGIGVKYSF
jgi:hypothetical protein